MPDQHDTRSLTEDLAREVRSFMKEQTEHLGEIRVQLERQGQLAIRMDYIEKDISEMRVRLGNLEKDVTSLRDEVARLCAKFDERTKHHEKEIDEARTERKSMQRQIAEFVAHFGPWAAVAYLVGQELLN